MSEHDVTTERELANAAPLIEVRPLRSMDDYAACVQLQRATWGQTYDDIVPPSILQVTQKVGGVCAGAFTSDGRMIGFVYGLTGLRNGRVVHWSDLLAVLPEFRDRGVGRRLKEYQRDVVRALGIDTMYWTYDPLVARNAHFNLNRLGVEVCEYVQDMYGNTGSELHAFGTDRFVVAWSLGAPSPRTATPTEWRTAPLAGDGVDALVQRIEIPADVMAIPLEQARMWRATTRAAFMRLLAADYRVLSFFTATDGRAFYVLARAAAGATSPC